MKSPAERKRDERARKREKGIVPVTVEVLESQRDLVRDLSKRLLEEGLRKGVDAD